MTSVQNCHETCDQVRLKSWHWNYIRINLSLNADISSVHCDFWDLIQDFSIQFQPASFIALSHISLWSRHKNDLRSLDEAPAASTSTNPSSSKSSVTHDSKQHQAVTREAYWVSLQNILRDNPSQMVTQTKVRLFCKFETSIIGKRWEKEAFSFPYKKPSSTLQTRLNYFGTDPWMLNFYGNWWWQNDAGSVWICMITGSERCLVLTFYHY